ncbi:MAG: septum formation protein Maf [Bacteroidales bacterium]|nr:septum formation protein Maf [Bacteroidales bacterium]
MIHPLEGYTLLLASKSPRRRQLLSQIGLPLRIVDVDVVEITPQDTPVDLIAQNLADIKSKAYPSSKIGRNEVLVTADTVVVLDGKVLGKPHDPDEALAMLRALSGHSHRVYTGVSLCTPEKQALFTECTEVCFRQVSDEIIRRYVNEGQCLDKAGSYGVQDWFGMVAVERIDGCYYNVMGLPVSRLYCELEHLILKS